MRSSHALVITALLIPLSFPAPCSAQYFSSFDSKTDAPPEARQASSNALAGLGSIFTALSGLEGKNNSGAQESFEKATTLLLQAIASYRSLAQTKSADLKINLQTLHPDERSFINDPGLLALGSGELNTAGDVFSLTAGALSVALTNLKTFEQSPSAENYATLRDDVSLLLRIGQVTTELLNSAH
jgi:hypothetical protein